MRTASNLLSFTITLLLILMLCSATKTSAESPKVSSTWKNDQFGDVYFKKVMIVGVSGDYEKRGLFEREFSEQLVNGGTDAVPSVDVIPADLELNREVVKNAAEKIKADIVLVTRVIGDGKDRIEESPMLEYIPDYIEHNFGPYFLEVMKSQSKDFKRKQIRLQSNLYETKTEKLVWSAQSYIYFEESNSDVIRFVCEGLIKQMHKRKGLIR